MKMEAPIVGASMNLGKRMAKSKYKPSRVDKAGAINYNRLRNDRYAEADFEQLAKDLTQGVPLDQAIGEEETEDEEDLQI